MKTALRAALVALFAASCGRQAPPQQTAHAAPQNVRRSGALTQSFASGSIIIPMDTTYQDNGTLRAFGLVNELLKASIPVYWIASSTKTTSTATDFTASAKDFLSSAPVTSYNYHSAPFVIDSTNAAAANALLTTWAKGSPAVTVHVATASFNAEVRRSLTAAPRMAVLQDGYEFIAFSYLNAAGIVDSAGNPFPNVSSSTPPYASPDIVTIAQVDGATGGAPDGILMNADGVTPRFCNLTSMHYGTADEEAAREIRFWLTNQPTHAFFECLAGQTFENAVNGHFLTTGGIQDDGAPTATNTEVLQPANLFAQFDGPFSAVSGALNSIGLQAGSTWIQSGATAPTVTLINRFRSGGRPANTNMNWLVNYMDDNPANGKVSLLSGHQYPTTLPISTNPSTNGVRLYLDGLFESPCTDPSGQPSMTLSKSAPATTNGNTVTFTINYSNTGNGPANNAVITDTLAAGLTFSSATGGGTASGQTVTWNLGAVPKTSSGSVTVTATVSADATYTNAATLTYAIGTTQRTLTSNTTSTVRDATPPVTTITAKPANPTNATSATFNFTASETATFQCKLDAGAFAACVSGQNYTALAAGSHTFTVKATDTAGNVETAPPSYTWTIDVTPPVTTILTKPANPTNSTTGAFTFSANKAGSTFQCKLDAGAFAACVSGQSYSGLAAGSHTFTVKATDTANNVETTPPSYTWTIDLTPPVTTILTKPANPTNSTTGAFTFSANKAGSTFQCKLDAGAFAACVSGQSYSGLAAGSHTFTVKATDTANNVETTPPSYTWTIDLTPPVTTILTKPANPTNSTTGAFTFSANKAGSTFQCKLDAGAFAACVSGQSYSSLAAGSHTFTVQATDTAGNVETTPPSYTWTIDLTPPVTTILTKPANPTNSTTGAFTFSANKAGSTFQCKLDAGAFAACVSGQSYSGLAAGSHTFTVEATDAAGNLETTPPSYTWTIDLTPPVTTILTKPANPTNSTTGAFTFSANKAGSTFQCKLDAGAFAACVSGQSYSGLAAGSHTFTVEATDTAGNLEATPPSYTWTIDLTPPVTTILTKPANPTNSTTGAFTFSANKAGSTFQCKLDAGAFAACVSGQSYSGLAAGSHTFTVEATDTAGNLETTPPSYTWTIDLTPPVTTILTKPANPTNSTTGAFTFSANKAGSTFQCKLDAGSFAACVSGQSYSGLAAGSHTFTVEATDTAGNLETTPPSYTWTIDLTPPVTTILTKPANPTNSTTGAFTFSANKAGSTFQCKLDAGAFAACTSGQSYSSLAAGSHTFTVQATDTAGNLETTPPSYTWTIDLTPPVTTILTKPANPTNSTTGAFTFSANKAGSTFQCKLDAGAFAACVSGQSYSGLATGSHTFTVEATDTAGNLETTPPSYTWTVDLTPPVTTILTKPANPTNSTTGAFTFSANKAGSTFQCKLDAGAFAACTSGQSYGSLAAGSHTFTVQATDTANNVETTPPSYTWAVDLTPPQTTIVTKPANPTNSTTGAFTFNANKPGSTFQCKLDAGAFAACVSGQSYSGLAAGSHTFTVQATDTAGNVETVPPAYSWTIDLTPPVTTILTQPANPTNSTTGAFTFSASKAGSTFQCKLDAGAFASCVSGQSYSGLAAGSHTFTVQATDAVGNVETAPPSYTWTIDLTAPVTTIVTKPANRTNSTTGAFTFNANKAGSTFQCKLDAGSFAACVSGQSYSGLTAGSHTFTVQATDAVGNVETTPPSYTWTIDLTAPVTTILTKPANPTNSTTGAFTFSANKAGSTFQCKLDAGSFAACVSGQSYSGLAAGSHTFTVQATDAVGNVETTPPAYTWTVDLTPPVTTILTKPANPTNSTTGAFTFSADKAGSTFQCKLDAGSFAACASGQSYSGLAAGSHTFTVKATDTAGNVETAPPAYSWTINLTAPVTTILTKPANPTNSTTGAFTFSANKAGSTFQCKLDAGSFAACVSGQSYSSLGAGSHTFTVQATDAVGNVETAPPSYTWTIDLTPPVTTILTKPANPTRSTTGAFTFTADKAGSTFQCKLDAGAFAACVSGQSYSGLAAGSHTFTVQATDAVGNVETTPPSYSWTVNLTPPVTTILTKPANPTNSTTGAFTFSANKAGSTFQCKLDAGAFAACASGQSYSGLAAGSHTFTVQATDAVGNVETAPPSYTWSIDTGAPATTITSGPANPTNLTGATFTFTASKPSNFQCKLDAGSFASCASGQSYSGLAVGSHTFTVQATDTTGNVEIAPPTYSWTIDQTPPVTTILTKPANPTNSTTGAFTFSADKAGSTFQCRLDAGAFASCASGKSYPGLAAGSHTFTVQATDPATNVETAPPSYTWTVNLTPPVTTILTKPANPTNSTTGAFTFSADKAGSTFQCKLDSGAFVACFSGQSYSGLSAGSHTFTVQATDTATNVETAPPSYTWTVDLTAPVTTILTKPANPSNSTSGAFTFSADKAGSTFQCKLDAGAPTSCLSGQAYGSLAAGSHTFTVQATDRAGNVEVAPPSYTWTVDLTPPVTTLLTKPANPTNATTGAFTFSVDKAGSTFQCRLDAGAFASCSSGKSYSGLAAGSHTFTVQATDTAGNVETAPPSYTWRVDLTPPVTTITSGPANPTNLTSATFAFNADKAGSTFQCKLDAGAFAACATGQGYSGLAAGSHTFSVKATDLAGNVETTPPTYSWTIDQTPPVTTIVTKPANPTNSTTGAFTFTADKPGSVFQCKLDAGAFAACVSGQSYSGLAAGSHTFTVQAVDTANNAEISPPSYTWTVDLTPPVTTIVTKPANPTNSTTGAFTFTADKAGSTFQCKLDAGAYASCVSGQSYSALAAGSHTFTVQATDPATNVETAPPSYTWTVDLTAPLTTILTEPANPTNSTTGAFTFSANKAGSTFQCQLDSGAIAACVSGQSYSGLAAGSHTFTVKATDTAGNVEATPPTYTWTIDLTPPVTTILTKPANPTNSTTGSFTFTADKAGSTFQCKLDAGAFAACVSGQGYSALSAGTHTFTVQATDTAGNVETAPPSYGWTVDLTPPVTTIVTKPANPTNATTGAFTFSADKAGSTFQCKLDTGAFTACVSGQSYSGLAAGSHTFTVKATDTAGNVETAPPSATWTVDLTPPVTSITSGPGNPTNLTSATFAFNADKAGSTFQCKLDAGAFAACVSGQGYSGLAAGSHTFTVKATDLAGNVETAPPSYSWTIDQTPPVTTIVTKPANPTSSTTGAFTFTADKPGSVFQCKLDAGAYASCVSGQTYSGLVAGSHTFTVQAVDTANNSEVSPPSYTWTVDLTAPVTTILTKPADPTNSTSGAFTFSANKAGSTFQCKLDAGAFAACVSGQSYTGLAAGSHTFTVQATDTAGNVETAPPTYTWTVDLTPPVTTITTGPANPTNATVATFGFNANKAATFQCKLDSGSYASCATGQSYSGLADGAHSLTVQATDAAGNVETTPPSYAWTVDTVRPVTTITAGPPSLSSSSNASFTFAANEPGTYRCSLDGAAFASCASPQGYTALANGAHTFAVQATDLAGNVEASPATRSWTIDTQSPVTTLVSTPPLVTRATDAQFAFISSKSGGSFLCSIDGAAPAACTTPSSYTALVDGTHTFLVKATDSLGNADPVGASWTWTVDTVAPAAPVITQPADGSALTTATPTISGTAEKQSSVRVFVDGVLVGTVPADASGNWTYALTDAQALVDGRHSTTATATDAAGNESASATAVRFTTLTSAPDTGIATGPAARTNQTSAAFTLTSNRANATFECSLDGAAFASCTASPSYGSIAEGPHALAARARDGAGNVDATPATWSWTVDLTAPAAPTITQPASGATLVTATPTVSGNAEPGSSVQIVLDGVLVGTVPADGTGAFSYTLTAAQALVDGPHSATAQATDVAGNQGPLSLVDSFSTLTGAPETSIVSAPPAITNQTSATLQFASNRSPVTYQCSLDGAAFAACAQTTTLTGLADGPHSLAVRAIDSANNVDDTPAIAVWSIDSTPPAPPTISAPTSGSALPIATPTIAGAAEPGAQVAITVDGVVVATVPAASNGTWSYTLTAAQALADGDHVATATATDAAGNVSQPSQPDPFQTFVTAPAVTLVSKPAAITNATTAAFTFTSSRTPATFACSIDGAPASACVSGQSYSGLVDGAHSFAVVATDVAGNSSAPATWSWTVDTVPPTTVISTGPAPLTNVPTATFTFTANEPGSTFECALDAGAFVACTSPASYSSLSDGDHVLHVRATDPAGNVDPSPAAWSWRLDTVPPAAPVIVTPADGSFTSLRTPTLSGTAEPGSAVALVVDGALLTTVTALADGSWSYTPTLAQALSEGAHVLTATATDAAGNTGPAATSNFTVDTIPPSTTLTGKPADPHSGDATFTFTSNEPGTFQCSLDGAAFAACVSGVVYPVATIPDGPHTFDVRAVDQAGNVDPAPPHYAWTEKSTPPAAPIISSPANNAHLSNRTPAISGTAEWGASVVLAIDGVVVGNPAVGARPHVAPAAVTHAPGVWSYTLTAAQALADGAHTAQGVAVDLAGNQSPPSALLNFVVDTTPPHTTIASGPSGLTNVATGTFTFTADEPATFECSLDGAAYVSCPTPSSFGPLADGPHTLSVRATDLAGNVDPTPPTRSWTIDTTPPPAPVISVPSEGATVLRNTPLLSGTAEAGSSVKLVIDGVLIATVTADVNGAWSYTVLSSQALADGAHTLDASATDAAGNTGPTATRHFNTQVVTLSTAITSGPPPRTNLTTASFTLVSSHPAATFECRLDGATAWTACASPYTTTGLIEGSHVLLVRSIDLPEVDPNPASWNWVVDLTPPAAPTLVAPADGSSIATRTPALAGTAEAASTVRAFADGVLACTAPAAADGSWSCNVPAAQALADGAHTANATATDQAGNASPVSATNSFTVFTTPPRTAITSGPPAFTASLTASFTLTSSTPGSTFQCALDGAAFASCVSPAVYSGLFEGTHILAARAIDPAGNVDPTPPTWSWTVDVTAPAAAHVVQPADGSSIATATPIIVGTAEASSTVHVFVDGALVGTVPADGSGNFQYALTSAQALVDGGHTAAAQATDRAGNVGPIGPSNAFTVLATAPDTTITSGPAPRTNATTATLTLAANRAPVTFQCRVDATGPFAACGATVTLSGLTERAHQLEARAIDTAGNVDATPAVWAWVVDLTPPAAPVVLEPVGGSTLPTATPTLAGSAEPGTQVTVTVDNVVVATVPADSQGNWSYTLTSAQALPDGSHVVTAQATDAAGNQGPASAPVSFSTLTDAPDTGIVSGPAAVTSHTDAPFVLSSNKSPVTYECSLDGAAFTACSSTPGYTGLAAGTHTFAARAKDSAGNVDPTPASTVWTIDLTPPHTTIVSGPPALTNLTNAAFAFGADKAGSTFQCSVDSGPFTACPNPTSLSGLADGTHTLKVRARDGAGNVDPTPASRTWTVDHTAPSAPVISTPAAGTETNSKTPLITGTAEAGSTVTVVVDGVAIGTAVAGPGGTWSLTPPSPMSDGPHQISATATDTAGNTSGPGTGGFTIDTVAPDTAIVSAPAALIAVSSAQLTFSATESPATFQCRISPATSFTACATPLSLTGLADGQHTVEVRATDAAGNTDPTPASATFVVDTTPPRTTIQSGPDASTVQTDAAFTFVASESPVTYECAVDGAAFAPCAASFGATGLSVGDHVLLVRARDAAGNLETTPARYAWTVRPHTVQFVGDGCSQAAPSSWLALLGLGALMVRRRRRAR